jgi:ankyrin repeat protein
MADPFDQDEFLPIAVPVRRRDRNRGPHFRAERAERADRADRFAERADRFGIIEREQIRRNPLPTTASPFLHDLIYEDCSCTANTSVRSGSTPLKGCQRIVERCRNFQDEVSYQHPRTGRTPLHVAAMQNACLHVFEAIMEVNDGTSVVFLDETGNTPLHLLFAGFHTRRMDPDEIHAIVELLLDPFSASFALRSNLAGSVPLHYACSAPESMIHPSTVQQLLKAAPSCASRVNSKGQTPLHLHCARRNASTSLAQILLEAYPEANHVLDSTSTDKWSPLHYAASDLNQDLIRFLVDADTTGTVANLACTRTGQTALHILCKKNPTERQLPAIQDILAAAPESVTRRDNVNSYTPLHSLCRGTVVSAAIVRAIVEAEPLVLQIPDENQYLALHHACEGGADPEVIDCLLRGFPAATKHLTRKNDTALSLACSANHSGETVRLLLDVGPDALVQKNDYGFSPLHCVCRAYQPNVEIIRAIVDINPAIVTEETNAGETAIHLASSSTGASVGLIEILTAARNTLGANNDLVMREKDMANNKVGNTPRKFTYTRGLGGSSCLWPSRSVSHTLFSSIHPPQFTMHVFEAHPVIILRP